MRYLHALTRSPPLPVLRAAIEAAAPAVRTTSTRIGAKAHFRPIALGEKQRTRFAVQWILAASEGKPGKKVEERLAREIIAVLQGSSEALKKKAEIHKFAMVNRYVILSLRIFAGILTVFVVAMPSLVDRLCHILLHHDIIIASILP
jgi:small subunit ribosomal protein S7